MWTTLMTKWQVTIPKQIRSALGLKPGMPVQFAVNQEGEMGIHKAPGSAPSKSDPFEAARGKAAACIARRIICIDLPHLKRRGLR